MSEIIVRKVHDLDDRSLPVFAEIDRVMESIGRRARELFARRGGTEGGALDDWLQAEREICWPAAELVERAKQFDLRVALPGYEPHDIELTATPRELIVHGHLRSEHKEKTGDVRWSEFRSSDIYRRIELPAAIDVGHVKAALKQGMLNVVAPKVALELPEKSPASIPIAA